MKTHDIVENAIVIPSSNLKKDHPDHEVSMARSDLYRSAKASMELHALLKKVSEEQGIEGWVAAKITKAADYLDSVLHYLQYEIDGPGAELDEQLPGTTTTAASPGVAAPGGTVVQANPQMAAAAAAKAAQQRKKALQDAIRQKQKELSDLQRQLSAPVTVSETASAGASAAGGIATSLGGGNGFKNGGPGTVKRVKKAEEGRVPGLQMDPKVIAVHKQNGFKGPFELKALPKNWYESLIGIAGAQDNSHVMITGKDPDNDEWIIRVENITGSGSYAYGVGDGGYQIGNAAKVSKFNEAAPNQLKGTDKPKKMQKPGVIDQPHPFKGKLVGGD